MQKRNFAAATTISSSVESSVSQSQPDVQKPLKAQMEPVVLRRALFDGQMATSIPTDLLEIIRSAHEYIVKGKSPQTSDPTEQYLRLLASGSRPKRLEDALEGWGTPEQLETLRKNLQYFEQANASKERAYFNASLTARTYEGLIKALVGRWSIGITGALTIASVVAMVLGHGIAFFGVLPLAAVIFFRFVVLYFADKDIDEEQADWDAEHLPKEPK